MTLQQRDAKIIRSKIKNANKIVVLDRSKNISFLSKHSCSKEDAIEVIKELKEN